MAQSSRGQVAWAVWAGGLAQSGFWPRLVLAGGLAQSYLWPISVWPMAWFSLWPISVWPMAWFSLWLGLDWPVAWLSQLTEPVAWIGCPVFRGLGVFWG